MNLSEGRLAPVPGADGLVTRTSGAVLFVATRTPVEQVRALTGAVTAATGPTPARALARQLATLVAADDEGALPGFALVADSTGGTYVKVYGSVEVHLLGAGSPEVLSGVGSFTGVDRELAGPFDTIAVHVAGEPTPGPVFDVDVQAGTATGDGFSITTLAGPDDAGATAPAAAAAPVAPVEAPAPVDDVALAAAPIVEPEPVAEPEPVVEEPVAAPEVAAAPDLVDEPVVEVPPVETAPLDAPLDPPAGAAAVDPAPDLDLQTQAWTPSTVDFDRDDLASGPSAADAAAEPAWGSAQPDPEPVADAPSPSLAKPAEEAPPVAPGTPTPVPESAAAPLTSPPASAPAVPVAWEDLPVADASAATDAAAAYEPATVAVPPEVSAEVADAVSEADVPPGDFTSQLLGALDEEAPEEREPLPVELHPSEVRQADQVTSEVVVQGVICARGHFNDPRTRLCSSCNVDMVQATQVLTQGPRPPLGVMVFEDGATFSLSSDYVVGRQPEVSELVQQGLALPLPVDDPERSISRAHAELRLVDWDVHLVNLSGTNGSFVWDENGQQWVPIPEGQSVVLTPGMRVALGRRSAVFESSLAR